MGASAQMRKLNQPIGAIQRNTKLMEPADCQRLKRHFVLKLTKTFRYGIESMVERSVQGSLWVVVGGKGRGGGNGDDLASMAERHSICWSCLFPKIALLHCLGCQATNTSDPNLTLDPQKSPNTFDTGHSKKRVSRIAANIALSGAVIVPLSLLPCQFSPYFHQVSENFETHFSGSLYLLHPKATR